MYRDRGRLGERVHRSARVSRAAGGERRHASPLCATPPPRGPVRRRSRRSIPGMRRASSRAGHRGLARFRAASALVARRASGGRRSCARSANCRIQDRQRGQQQLVRVRLALVAYALVAVDRDFAPSFAAKAYLVDLQRSFRTRTLGCLPDSSIEPTMRPQPRAASWRSSLACSGSPMLRQCGSLQ